MHRTGLGSTECRSPTVISTRGWPHPFFEAGPAMTTPHTPTTRMGNHEHFQQALVLQQLCTGDV